MEFVSNVFWPVIFGVLLMLFSKQLADFFGRTGSTSLIRGLDNAWTFKTLGFVLVVGYPLYYLVSSSLILSIG